MQGLKLLLLSVGLCIVTCYDKPIKLYGSSFNPYEDVSTRLEVLNREKLRLEAMLTRTAIPTVKRWEIQKELNRVRTLIRERQETARVSYKDYLDMMEKQKEKFEKEKGILQKELEKSENSRIRAVNDMVAMEKKNERDIYNYKEKIDLLTKGAERIAKEYAEYTEKQAEELEEKNKLLKEKEDLMQKLEEAQNRHSWALEAMAVVSKKDNTTVLIPHQDEINEFRHRIYTLVTIGYQKEQMATIKENLEALRMKLYQESNLSETTPTEDLEALFEEAETSTVQLRDEQNSQSKILQEEIKSKNEVNNEEETNASLRNSIKSVGAANEFLQNLAQRKAYLKAIMQVSELMEKCSYLPHEVLTPPWVQVLPLLVPFVSNDTNSNGNQNLNENN